MVRGNSALREALSFYFRPSKTPISAPLLRPRVEQIHVTFADGRIAINDDPRWRCDEPSDSVGGPRRDRECQRGIKTPEVLGLRESTTHAFPFRVSRDIILPSALSISCHDGARHGGTKF